MAKKKRPSVRIIKGSDKTVTMGLTSQIDQPHDQTHEEEVEEPSLIVDARDDVGSEQYADAVEHDLSQHANHSQLLLSTSVPGTQDGKACRIDSHRPQGRCPDTLGLGRRKEARS